MIRIVFTIIFLLQLLSVSLLHGQEKGFVGPRPLSANRPVDLRKYVQFGEKLVYMAKWTGFPAGTITTRVWPKLRKLHDKQVFMFQMSLEGNDFFNAFYSLKTELNSFVDPAGGWSYRMRRRVREGDYVGNDRVIFDYDHKDELGKRTPLALPALIRDSDVEAQSPFNIPGHLCDPLAFKWYLRGIPLTKKGDRSTILVGDRYGMGLVLLEVDRVENLVLPGLGTFRCLVVKPNATTYDGKKSLLDVEGEAFLWLEINTRIILRAQARLPVGQASATLVFQENTKLKDYALKIKKDKQEKHK